WIGSISQHTDPIKLVGESAVLRIEVRIFEVVAFGVGKPDFSLPIESCYDLRRTEYKYFVDGDLIGTEVDTVTSSRNFAKARQSIAGCDGVWVRGSIPPTTDPAGFSSTTIGLL
ncbi:unnamed protein product, partial [marine sediment metagenome]